MYVLVQRRRVYYTLQRFKQLSPANTERRRSAETKKQFWNKNMMDSWDGDDNDDVDYDSYDDHVDIDDDKDDHGNDFDNKKQREGHGMLPTCESHQIPIIMSVWELATKRQRLTQLWQNCQM